MFAQTNPERKDKILELWFLIIFFAFLIGGFLLHFACEESHDGGIACGLYSWILSIPETFFILPEF